jgi:hypothetical protein
LPAVVRLSLGKVLSVLSLEAAQPAMMDHVCHKLRLRPGQTAIKGSARWFHYRFSVTGSDGWPWNSPLP